MNLLVGWWEKYGRQKEAAAVVRELGTPEQRVLLMIEEGKVEDAVELALKNLAHLPGVMIRVADALASAGAGEQAAALIDGQVQGKNPHWSYLEWLTGYHQEHGDPAVALAYRRKLSLEHPSVKEYAALRRAAVKLGVWEQVREEV